MADVLRPAYLEHGGVADHFDGVPGVLVAPVVGAGDGVGQRVDEHEGEHRAPQTLHTYHNLCIHSATKERE